MADKHSFVLHNMLHSSTVVKLSKVFLYLTKTLMVETLYIAIIALVLLRECSPSLLLI